MLRDGKGVMHRSSSHESVATDSLRLATAPVNWNNNDIPDWRPHVPFPDILDRMQEAGYSATEYDVSFGTDPVALRNEADAWDMSWCGCYQWVDFLDRNGLGEAFDTLAPLLELLDEIDCRHLIVADALRPHRLAMAGRVPTDGSSSLGHDDLAVLAGNVHRLADLAADHSLSVHYHNHVGTWIETPQEVESLLELLDPNAVDLCFDTGHFAYGGGDAARFIRDRVDRIGYLHMKDVDTEIVKRARDRGLTFIEALKEYVFSPIGQGTVDIPVILHTLVDARFEGWVVIEQDTCEGDATIIARNNLGYIKGWLAEHHGSSTNGR